MDSDDSRPSSSDDESPVRSTRSSRSRSGSRSNSGDRKKSDCSSSSSETENQRGQSPSSESDISDSHSRPDSPKSVSDKDYSLSRKSFQRSSSNSPGRLRDRKWLSRSSEKSPKGSENSVDSSEIKSLSPNTCGVKNASNNKSRTSSPHIEENENDLPRDIKSPSANSKNSSQSSSRESSPDKKSPDRTSIKSASSSRRSKSSIDGLSVRSGQSSKNSRRRKSNGNSSDSSSSSAESSSRKNISNNADIQPEEISDGDMESDGKHSEDEKEKFSEPVKVSAPEITMSHEDLSDVSDLEDSIGPNSEEEPEKINYRQEINEQYDKEQRDIEVQRITEKSCKNENEEGEEQLDFEAEDGECGEIEEPKKPEYNENDSQPECLEDGEMEADKEEIKKEEKKKEDLEEGEVSDEDDIRPEETEPRPVCRFFSRGQCTWGASCRFLHPGVTDKGNYTMFEMIRPLVPGEFGGGDRFVGRPEPAPIESAWERGLRTAKEMLRKSMKRKEQDIDFEEKKMNLTLAQEEFDKENGYYGRVTSPEPRYVGRHPPVEFPAPARAAPDEYYNRRQVVYEPEFAQPRERIRPAYRELPTHKMPDYYNNKYEEEVSGKRKPKREVIVQRVDREREREREDRPSRADDWSDPWMRSKSPAGKRGGRKRSYSSGSSYSSSSSTRSSSSRSSYRSRSRSNSRRRRRSRSRKSRHVSPSVIVSERKAANERAAMMNPPAPRKRAPSPGMIRAVTAANPPAPADQFGRTRSKLAVAAALARARGKRKSRSSSDSSGSSSSDSDSSGSSSSSSRDESPPVRRPPGDISLAKAMDALKGNSSEKRQIKLNLKTPLSGRKPPELAELARKMDQAQGKKRPANSPPPGDPKNKKAASRREELLKQLKAVEDAIAKKRSKVN